MPAEELVGKNELDEDDEMVLAGDDLVDETAEPPTSLEGPRRLRGKQLGHNPNGIPEAEARRSPSDGSLRVVA